MQKKKEVHLKKLIHGAEEPEKAPEVKVYGRVRVLRVGIESAAYCDILAL
jgi:hypothetical protein